MSEPKMQVQVRLYGRLRSVLPPDARGTVTLDLPVGSTLDDLLGLLSAGEQARVIQVNGYPEADRRRSLHPGDEIQLFPVAGGG